MKLYLPNLLWLVREVSSVPMTTQVTFTRGTWTDAGNFKKTTQFASVMQIAYTGDEALLTIGTGPDHGQFDLYINGRYWRRFDAYTAQPGERVIHLPQVTTPTGETSGTLEIRNRSDRHHRSTGYVFRFKQLAVIDATYNERTIDYTYDGLSRLTQADYDDGTTIYDYAYDLAGNLTNNNGKTRTYNATNQLTNDGTHTLTYDANGNLTNDGTNTYTWDRANRLKSLGTTTYSYDGLGNRVSMSVGTTSPTVTDYLLDVQPGLVKVLAQTTGAATDRFVHSPRGIHAMQDNASDWRYMTQDGLGSVRSEIDSTLGVNAVQSYNPYGEPFGTVGNFDTPFAFTGEQVDSTGQVYLRARYYDPSLGVFSSLDPFEGTMARPMSLNGYSWVEGNPIMNTDPSGKAMVDIWVAAFIEPDTIQFSFAADPKADWNGNGRSWHTLADFGSDPPPSSKAWWSLRFDTNNLSTAISRADTGETSVTYGGVLGVYTSQRKAPMPDPATVECTGPDSDDSSILNDVWVQIEENAKNPLIPFAPPIEISYSILIMPQSGKINVTRDIDRYPWHELHIAVDGVSVVQLQQSPPGPFKTPADLAFPSLRSVFTNIGSFPPDGPCRSSRNQPPPPCRGLPIRNACLCKPD